MAEFEAEISKMSKDRQHIEVPKDKRSEFPVGKKVKVISNE